MLPFFLPDREAGGQGSRPLSCTFDDVSLVEVLIIGKAPCPRCNQSVQSSALTPFVTS